ncbi:hypothetical protein LCGC14_0664440 [marine sediment metagenome]|uniref:Uncharacterized protein n=1 Tax=marine sediment metagenome TaxID=412755 RepID=A0A0F9U0Z4_9ZZZZ|nr:hypothetical protein [bacterium]
MPIGFLVMKWDTRAGAVILARYPEDTSLDENTLMQVTSAHEYSAESGFTSLMVGSINITSYFTGPEEGYYFLLLLNLDEDSDSYEDGLRDTSQTILLNLKDDAYIDLIPSLFTRLSVFPRLVEEQRLALIYSNKIKRVILNRLRDEGVISKSELMIWAKDIYKEEIVDLEGMIMDLIKKGLVKEGSVKGLPSELIFLIYDIIATRTPPVKLFDDPSSRGLPAHLVEDYRNEINIYFKSYKPTEDDNVKLAEIFNDPQTYETLRLLRTAIVTKNDIEKLKKKGVDDIDFVLKALWDAQMIHAFQDERKNEYYALVSDFYIKRIFPKYLMNVIKREYEQKSKANQVLVEYINVLESTYLSRKETAKIKAEEL